MDCLDHEALAGGRPKTRLRRRAAAVVVLSAALAALAAWPAFAAPHSASDAGARRPAHPVARTPRGPARGPAPRFRWTRVRGVRVYEVRVYQGRRLVRGATVRKTRWTPRSALPLNVTLTWKVRGRNSAGRSAWSRILRFTLYARPVVTALTPAAGPTSGGTSVTVSGSDLAGASAVSFGGQAATSFTIDSPTEITAFAPAHAAGTVAVTVTTPGGTSADTSADDYEYGVEFVASYSAYAQDETTVTVDVATAPADGDLMVVMIESINYSLETHDPTGPDGWAKLASDSATYFNIFTANWTLWYRVADGDAAGARSWGFDHGGRTAATVAVYRGGFDQSDPIDAVSNIQYILANGEVWAGSVTTSAANELLLWVGGSTSPGRALSGPDGYVQDSIATGFSWLWATYFAHSADFQASPGASGDVMARLEGAAGEITKHAFLIALNPAP